MMRHAVVYSLLVLLLCGSRAWAEGEVCFSPEMAKALVVEVEQGRVVREELALQKEATAELEKQVALLKEMNDLRKQEVEIQQRTIEQYRDIIKVQGDSYDKALKATQPNTLQKIVDAAGWIGIGVIIALLL